MIESITNSKIKYAVKLKQKKYRNLHNQFLVEGDHLVLEAKKNDMIDVLFYTDNDYNLSNSFKVSTNVMKKLSELGNTTGAIAICNKPVFKELSSKVLILDGIQDPGNLGTLIRTAAAFDFRTIVSENTVDYYNEKVIRSSQGALFYTNLIETDIIDFVKNNSNYHYYGTDVSSGQSITEEKFKKENIAIILGNEGSGVRKAIKDLVNTNINIPMSSTESLNVAIAGGILMYEASKEK
ncbi:TrmH family RNA methyltransferase [Candidatus Izemoplasma sp. B36]|uniref:TrmH family RNA methyltransferase n=1 Tax=Candidatus Izemoplasma sp. B36 TaxID=3242468 RepID=UPI00355836C2